MNDVRPVMNARWFVAFSFLLLAVHEAHELAHAVTGKIVCGVWPVRDFNSWSLSGDCGYWPTAMGPVFSYVVMLLGSFVALEVSRMGGVAIILSANPFARIFTAVMGGGDEMVVGQRLAGLATRTVALRIAVIVFVAIICGSAIAVAWRAMSGMKARGAWFALVLIWPMVLTGVLLFVIGNSLLRAGVLDGIAPGGAPLLVTLVSAAAAGLAIVTHRWLLTVRTA
ncbi:MAG TPA: hypothetical protein VF787_28670 [Thermoanaerobaculia bacterium]